MQWTCQRRTRRWTATKNPLILRSFFEGQLGRSASMRRGKRQQLRASVCSTRDRPFAVCRVRPSSVGSRLSIRIRNRQPNQLLHTYSGSRLALSWIRSSFALTRNGEHVVHHPHTYNSHPGHKDYIYQFHARDHNRSGELSFV